MPITRIQPDPPNEHAIKLSADAIARDIQRYQVILAARKHEPEILRCQNESVAEKVFSIDGLQPEKGQETLGVARDLTRQQVWFADA
jgi:hypothetical protein